MKIAMLLSLLPLHAAAQWMTVNKGAARGYNCLTKDAKGVTTAAKFAADCDIQYKAHPELCVDLGGQCAMSKADAEKNCGAIEGCAGVYCYDGYDADKRCIARSASELAFHIINNLDGVYNMLKPLDTKQSDDTKLDFVKNPLSDTELAKVALDTKLDTTTDTQVDTKLDTTTDTQVVKVTLDTKTTDTKLADSPEGTTPECDPTNGFGTECLAEWQHQIWESDTVNKHCTTGTDYHIKCQDCEWCTEFIQPDTQVAKEEFAPMDVTKFKDELASAMVVMMPSKCNVRDCAHWNCGTWCWCFEHYGHLIQPWLDTYAANAGCLSDGTDCICKPDGPGPTGEGPVVDIYKVPNEWVDKLLDPSPLDKIRQQFIAEKFPYIPEYKAPVEDGPGSWGEPTEQEMDAMLQIIDLYLPINSKEHTTDARIELQDKFDFEIDNLAPLAGAQVRRPQMQQFRTMVMAIEELRASKDAHDHATAREMELQLDTNLRSLKKALTTQF